MASRTILSPSMVRFCRKRSSTCAFSQGFHPNLTRAWSLGARASHRTSSIADLQKAFRDPNSPYHLPPGTQGPSHPGDTGPEESDTASVIEDAKAKLIEQGYDPASFFEQKIVWGDHDAFQHVNNVRYVRFFESGRMLWITAVGNVLGGPQKANELLSAKGISFILKSIEVKFRRPVRYPDTLLIAHKAERWPDSPTPSSSSSNSPPLSRTQFYLHATAYSYAQQATVADSTSVITWYDYDKLKKCDPGDEAWAVVLDRIR